MNYTYLPSTPFPPHRSSPCIIMTTNPSSRKTLNLLANPNVSLLVHDWVSHRPPTLPPSTNNNTAAANNNRSGGERDGSSPPPQQQAAARSSLASLLLGLNTSALSSISATIEGTARMVEQGSEEERWCKRVHLDNHRFGDRQHQQGRRDEQGTFRADGRGEEREEEGVDGDMDDGGASCFIEGEDVRVVVVGVREGRIADWKGGVKDWVIVPEGEEEEEGRGGSPMVNGVV
ncbi:MAG: hypothetical protein LQ338_000641 [Usnochroma carphineum]|nr:MAG: hypothetical protein LQ338_000641 [Usnochroma carphineum]